MDLRLSYNWLKEHLKTAASPEAVARLLTLHAHTVDRVEHVKPAWKGVVTAKILEIKKHPNADKLRLARVTDGKQEYEVVCGAPNIQVGQTVPFAAVGATLRDPKTGGTWTLTAAKIRGVESRGMLCATDELGVGEDHSGIWVLPSDTPLGVPLEKIYPAEDVIFYVEVTSNRPDCMSVHGLAREAAAVLPKAKLIYRNIEISKFRGVEISKSRNIKSLPLAVKVSEPKLCPRYQAVAMTDVTVGPSPLWLQQRLIAAGQRPINNLVDITNYARLEYGNPLHVFDYEKLDGKQIIVRKAKAGEKVAALDGKTYQLTANDLVIADAQKPVAIAGVMGGEGSAATSGTKTIVFEVANFDPISVRKTSRRLSLISDSSLLFEKGLPPQATETALGRAVELTQQIAGGKVASHVVDVKRPLSKPRPIPFNPEAVSQNLGVEIKPAAAKKILQALGFAMKILAASSRHPGLSSRHPGLSSRHPGLSSRHPGLSSRHPGLSRIWNVTPPWWRQGDVAELHDIVEEVARVWGYHNLAAALPAGPIPARPPEARFALESAIRTFLVGQGFTEVHSYSFISGKQLEAVGVPPGSAPRVANPLSAELEYLRPTLSASLLSVVGQNIKRFPRQQLFELANIYQPKPNDLPAELPTLVFAITNAQDIFFAAKGIAEALVRHLGVRDYQWVPEATASGEFWQPRAQLVSGGKVVGRFGAVSPAALERFGIRQPLALFGMNVAVVAALARAPSAYQPIPLFPPSGRDLAMIVDAKMPWQRLRKLLAEFHPLIRRVTFLSAYQDAKVGAGKKSVACSLEFRADDRTLSATEVESIMEKLVAKLRQEFQAAVR